MHLFAPSSPRGPPSMTSTTWSRARVVADRRRRCSRRRRVHVGVRRARAVRRADRYHRRRAAISAGDRAAKLPHRRQHRGAGAQAPRLRAERQLPAPPVPGLHAGRDARHDEPDRLPVVQRALGGDRPVRKIPGRHRPPVHALPGGRRDRRDGVAAQLPPHGERHRRRPRRRQGAARDAGRGRGIHRRARRLVCRCRRARATAGRTWATRT